jgi:hypothetical protein
MRKKKKKNQVYAEFEIHIRYYNINSLGINMNTLGIFTYSGYNNFL